MSKKKISKNTKNIKNSKNKSDINVANKLSNVKIILVPIFLLILMLILLGRILYWQNVTIDGEKLQTIATSNQTFTETLSAKRGNIYDVNGQELAFSYYTDKVYIDPSVIKTDSDKEIIAQGLAPILGIDSNELLVKLKESKKRFSVASNVEKDAIDKMKDWKSKLEIPTGISIETSSSRIYPHHNLASTVLGCVGKDNQGLAGIESSWDSFLSGTSGKSVSLKDATKSEIANSNKTYIAAENGYDITLTIDYNIQNIVEKYLAEAVDEYKCKSGMTIAMDPSTGKILALADYPNYDCNIPFTPNSKLAETWDSVPTDKRADKIYRMWSPKAVTDMYEPGSVFKIITSAIALEENIIESDKIEFNCTGSIHIPGEKRPINCHRFPNSHGKQTLTNALENSCNPAFVDLGLRIGKDISYKYYEALGFFGKTGISLSGERAKGGIFYPINTIRDHELGTLSFGQRFTITPIQMITAAASIANDGVLVQPQIIDHITNTDDGEVTTFNTNEVRQVFSKETADTVASMMESVVEHGTGKRVKYDANGKVIPAMSGYSIGGKTGTSEPIYANKDDGYIASFLALSPVENTKIVLLVILDTPGEGVNHNGGQIAAPTAQKMLAEILPYLNIETGNKDNENNTNISEKDLY